MVKYLYNILMYENRNQFKSWKCYLPVVYELGYNFSGFKTLGLRRIALNFLLLTELTGNSIS